jgi:GNAT superfamily N-acetyltransferase
MLGQAALKIRPVKSFELPLLKDFAPPEWNTNIAQRFTLYFGQPFFYPIVAERAGEIVGCANGLLNGAAGWLGNIIVLPEYRGQGIGSDLTTHLIEYFRYHGCISLVLIATKLGEPVYSKLGFKVSSTYTFLRSEKILPSTPTPHIHKAQPVNFDAMQKLDQEITGERRTAFLERFLAGGWIFQAGTHEPISGFFLPGLENGPILARDAIAGLGLLQFKLGSGYPSVVVPSSNQPALDLLLGSGFHIENTAARMTLGEELDWKPEGVFSRGGGFCG